MDVDWGIARRFVFRYTVAYPVAFVVVGAAVGVATGRASFVLSLLVFLAIALLFFVLLGSQNNRTLGGWQAEEAERLDATSLPVDVKLFAFAVGLLLVTILTLTVGVPRL